MKKLSAFLVSIVLLFCFSASVSATTITNLYGDKDGFGIGILPNQSYSGFYPTLSKNDAADGGTITDQYLWDDQSWSQIYDISGLGTITSATLEVFTYGQGWHGISSIYFEDVLVGQLTDGDNSGAFLETNWARLDTYDLLSFGVSLDGISTIRVATVGTDDQWALDYSELKISNDGAPVPEPTTMLLVGSGIAGLAAFRKRFRKS